MSNEEKESTTLKEIYEQMSGVFSKSQSYTKQDHKALKKLKLYADLEEENKQEGDKAIFNSKGMKVGTLEQKQVIRLYYVCCDGAYKDFDINLSAKELVKLLDEEDSIEDIKIETISKVKLDPIL